MTTEEATERREIEARIAREVFGWTSLIPAPPDTSSLSWEGVRPNGRGDWVPRYSEKIGAAWLVVERMRQEGWACYIAIRPAPPFAEVQLCEVGRGRWLPLISANDLPQAICAAALDWAERRETNDAHL